MAVTRSNRTLLIITSVAIVVVIVGVTVWLVWRNSASEPQVDPADIMDNIPDAEVMWFSQPEETKEQICASLAADPDGYYSLMKETWLEEAQMDPALFGALMTTIIDECGA
jgi:hypothetical protein